MALIKPTDAVPVLPVGTAYDDGTAPHGSAVLTITGNAPGGGDTVYRSQNFSPTFGSTRVEQKDESGVPTRAFGTRETGKGTSTWQIPTVDTMMPDVGNVFTANVFPNKSWIVESVGTPFQQEQYLIVEVGFIGKIN